MINIKKLIYIIQYRLKNGHWRDWDYFEDPDIAKKNLENRIEHDGTRKEWRLIEEATVRNTKVS